jgi:acyl-CoA oxidase
MKNALHTLQKSVAELLTFEIITPQQARWLSQAYRHEILRMTTAEAVQITDAFAFTDYELGSLLGKYDGRVYEALWDEVRTNPINSAPKLKEEVLKMIRSQSKL